MVVRDAHNGARRLRCAKREHRVTGNEGDLGSSVIRGGASLRADSAVTAAVELTLRVVTRLRASMMMVMEVAVVMVRTRGVLLAVATVVMLMLRTVCVAFLRRHTHGQLLVP